MASHGRTRGNSGFFWHERLDVYRAALELSGWVHRISPHIPRGRANLRDNLVRSSDSVVLNIAEGAAVPGKVGRNHYRVALRESAECHACFQLLEIAGLKGAPEAIELTHRIRSMLAGLTR